MQGFQIEAKEERGRLIPRELWRADAAELELDLELGRLWRRTGGAGEVLVVQRARGEGGRARGGLYIGERRSTVGSCAGGLVLVATGLGRRGRGVWGVPGRRLCRER